MPAILYMNSLCNKYGLDTVSTGNIIALLMDLYDRKIITKKNTDGIPMLWGDTEAMIAMIHKIARGEGVGKKLAVDSLAQYRPYVYARGTSGYEYSLRVTFIPDTMGSPFSVDFAFTGAGFG